MHQIVQHNFSALSFAIYFMLFSDHWWILNWHLYKHLNVFWHIKLKCILGNGQRNITINHIEIRGIYLPLLSLDNFPLFRSRLRRKEKWKEHSRIEHHPGTKLPNWYLFVSAGSLITELEGIIIIWSQDHYQACILKKLRIIIETP